MDNLVKDMTQFLRNRKSETLLSYKSNSQDKRSLVVAIIDILSWLKLGYKRELWMKEGKSVKQKPLKINMDYPWCQELKQLVEEDHRFSEYFTMTEKEFDFNQKISDGKRSEMRKTAFDLYNPQMRT
ncbi:hypothetical protein ACWOFR_06390 [Carnobacterium gallinarum]|uniref:hypothetical protein n=1 Tax=Carnobacterium gallinarum TaxID=2749 RepID=UPI0012F882F0|nr:hypothetical protein [Carnobacterium gallinarum]